MKTLVTMICAAALGLGLSSTADAQAMPTKLGEFEYLNSCAACHGADGKGQGSIAGYLNTALPDLTQLQAKNDGVFPVSLVFGVIAGGPEVSPHGTRDMPAWGKRYVTRAEADPEFIEDPAEYSRLRVLALVEYLSTLQAE